MGANDADVPADTLLWIQAASNKVVDALVRDYTVDIRNNENIRTLYKVLLCSSDPGKVDVTETCDNISSSLRKGKRLEPGKSASMMPVFRTWALR